MRVVFAHIKKYKILEDVTVNLDHAFSYSIVDEKTIAKTPKAMPANFFAENLTLNCIIGKNGSGKTLLMDLLFEKAKNIGTESHYCILYDCGDGFYLKRVTNSDCRCFKLVDSGLGFLMQQEELDHYDLVRSYNSYYLSCNNSNMLKTSGSRRPNDWSMGNQNRFGKKHNLYEIYYYSLLDRGTISIPQNSLKRMIVISVRYSWIKKENQEKSGNKITSGIIFRDIIYNKDAIRAFCIFFLTIISRRVPFEKQNAVNSESFSNSKNASYYESLTRFCLFKLRVIDELLIPADQRQDIESLFYDLEKHSRVYGDHVEFITHHRANKFIGIFFDIINTLHYRSSPFKVYLEPPFSTGQWKRIDIASKLRQLAYERPEESVVNIFLDEPDADLHPEIQTELIAWLVALLKDSKKKINLIISTHNPIILSDFPAEAIVSLGDRYSNQVKQTFGANIYELYKNSFGVENAMGVFAAEKISQAILGDDKDIALLTFLRGEISEPLIVNEIDKILDNASVRHKVDAIYDSLTAEEIALLRQRMEGNDNA